MRNLFSPSPWLFDAGIALIRIITGFFMIYHGWEIMEPEKMNAYLDWDIFKRGAGKWLVYGGKAAELVVGVFLLLGLFTRIAAIILVLTMAYIAFIIGHGKVWYEDQHPFLFVLLGLVFVFTGPGKFSVDHSLYKKKRR